VVRPCQNLGSGRSVAPSVRDEERAHDLSALPVGRSSSRKQRTALGYRRFSCAGCRRRFNERTGTAFNELQFPTDIVLLAVLWRLRHKLGLRDVAELLLQRGYDVSYETIRAWEFRFTALISADLRMRRHGHGGRSWYLDET